MTKKIIGYGGGKSGGGGGHVPTEDANSLLSRQYARVLDLISEGEIEGLVDGLRSVYLDDTPIQNDDDSVNFTGVTFESRNGSQSQSVIPGFAISEAEQVVNAEITQATPVVRTFTNVNLTAVRVTIAVPQLTFQNPKTGDLKGSEVELAIELQSNGGGFVAVPVGRAWTSDSASGTLYTRNSIYGIGCTVEADTAILDNETLDLTIEYRAVGAPTWTAIQSITWTYTDNASFKKFRYSGSDEFYLTSEPPINDFYTLALPLGNYEIRVVRTGGDSLANPIITRGYFLSQSSTDIIRGKTTSRYQRTYRVDLTGSPPWDIRVRRITADSSKVNLQNDTFWDTYTEVIDAKLSYPNSAICALQIDASQFSRIPTRGYEIKGLRVQVPTNYNPNTRQYTGTWDGTFKVAWTDNPAWCFYDLVKNTRYGLGAFNVGLDKFKLYTIAQYCDQMVNDGRGGVEPRFTCNLYLQTRAEAFQVVTNFASIFRSMAWWGAGNLQVSQDSPSDPIMQFTPSNIIDGEFNYEGTSSRVRHTVALVAWNDPENDYRQAIEYVEDAEGISRYGVIQTEITAFGCTSRGQAHRIGKWLLFSERLETEIITFQTGLDGVFVYPGAVIRTVDPFRAGVRFGGRLKSATTTQVVLDSTVVIETGKAYSIYCQLTDGSIEVKSITNAPSTTDTLTLSSALSSAPQPQSIWVLSANDLVPETWRVISVRETEKTTLEIVAVSHHPEKFAAVEQNIRFDIRPVSALTVVPPKPTDLVVTESLYEAAVGIVGIKAHVSWKSTQPSFIVSYRRQDSNWTDIEVRTPSIDIFGLEEDFYEFAVKSINAIGITSAQTKLTQQILGKLVPPTDPSGLIAAQNGDLAVFRVPRSPDLDFLHFEFRYGPKGFTDWDSMTPITDNFGKQVTLSLGETSLSTADLPPGDWTIAVKAVDTSLIYSANAAYDDLNFTSKLDVIDSVISEPDWIGSFSLQFDGVDDYVELTSQPAWSTALTVAALVTTGPTVDDALRTVFNNNQVFLRVNVTGGVTDFEFFVRSDAGVEPRAETSVAIQPNTRYVVFGRWNGSTASIRVYSHRTGALLASGQSTRAITLTSTTASARWGAGQGTNTSTQFWNGKFHWGRLYSRALTDDECALLATGEDTKVDTTGLLVEHHFNEGKGTTTRNHTGTENIGTISGATWVIDREAHGFVLHHTGALVPDSTKLASEMTVSEMFEQYVPYPRKICMYDVPELDISFDNNVRIWNMIDSKLGPGVTSGVANPATYIDFREEARAYDGYESWSIGNRNLRYLKSRIVLDTTVGNVLITSLVVTADLEERIEQGTSVEFSSTGTPIVFAKRFHRLPHVQITPIGSSDATAGADAVTTTGFTGYKFPSGLVNWRATGV